MISRFLPLYICVRLHCACLEVGLMTSFFNKSLGGNVFNCFIQTSFSSFEVIFLLAVTTPVRLVRFLCLSVDILSLYEPTGNYMTSLYTQDTSARSPCCLSLAFCCACVLHSLVRRDGDYSGFGKIWASLIIADCLHCHSVTK